MNDQQRTATSDPDEVRAELTRMDGVADEVWQKASTLCDRLERIYLLTGGCVLNEDGGDNVSATVPIEVWREMIDLARNPWENGSSTPTPDGEA